MIDDNSKHLLERIANALDRMAPAEKKINKHLYKKKNINTIDKI